MTRTPVHPYWGILEIAIFAVLAFAGIWIAGPLFSSIPGLAILFWILVVAGGFYMLWISPFKLHQFAPRDWGWEIRNTKNGHTGSLRKAWPVYTIFTIAAAALLLLYTLIFRPESFSQINGRAVIIKFAGYLAYGTVQSIIFFGFILTRIRHGLTSWLHTSQSQTHLSLVVFLTASIFSLFHLPNTALMVCTFITGLFWSWIFYERPNILLMGLSHAILGTILHQVVKLHMRVGPFYNNPDLYIIREVVPGLKKLIGNLF